MEEEKKKEFLDVPVFVSLGKRPYVNSQTTKTKKPPILTPRGRVVVVSLLVLIVSGLIFWLL